MKLITLTFAAALAASGSAFAASPFVGSWKMDAAKSSFTGNTATYTKTATGYHVANGSTAYDFADDGRPYAAFGDRTVAWTKAPDGGWDLVFVAKGKTLAKGHRKISADGATMTTTYEEYLPDGTTVHESDAYTRLGAGSGLEGSWKSTKVDVAPDTLLISPAGATGFRLDFPNQKATFTTKLDGTAETVMGPTVPAGATGAFQKVDANKWTYTDKLGAKVTGLGVMIVSADGATLTDTSWAPGKEEEKSVEVYNRQ